MLQLQEIRTLILQVSETEINKRNNNWIRKSRTEIRTEKKSILKQVFFLEHIYEINLSIIDFSQLMNEKSFTVSCQIIQNEYEIILKALVDSEADDLVFINIFCAIEVTKFFNTTVIYLNTSCSVHEYDEKSDIIIIHMIILHLVVNDCH